MIFVLKNLLKNVDWFDFLFFMLISNVDEIFGVIQILHCNYVFLFFLTYTMAIKKPAKKAVAKKAVKKVAKKAPAKKAVKKVVKKAAKKVAKKAPAKKAVKKGW